MEKRILTFHKKHESEKSMFDMPVSLSFIGLTTFPGVLDYDEKQWCLDTIADTLLQIVKHKLNIMSFTSPPYNIMKKVLRLSPVIYSIKLKILIN